MHLHGFVRHKRGQPHRHIESHGRHGGYGHASCIVNWAGAGDRWGSRHHGVESEKLFAGGLCRILEGDDFNRESFEAVLGRINLKLAIGNDVAFEKCEHTATERMSYSMHREEFYLVSWKRLALLVTVLEFRSIDGSQAAKVIIHIGICHFGNGELEGDGLGIHNLALRCGILVELDITQADIIKK